LPVGTQRLAHVPAVRVWQADVEDERVEGGILAEEPDRFPSVVGDDDVMPSELHRLDDDAPDRRIVLTQTDTGHVDSSLAATGRAHLTLHEAT